MRPGGSAPSSRPGPTGSSTSTSASTRRSSWRSPSAAGLALILFFRATHLGLQTRAVVDNRALSGLVGTNSAAVTRFSWMLGCSFAAISGILFAPFVGLDSLILTLLVVEAFGAAAVGRLQSFPRTAVAAFGVGVLQSVITKIVGEIGNPALTALPSAVPFIVLFVVLLFSRQTQLQRTAGDPAGHRPPEADGQLPVPRPVAHRRSWPWPWCCRRSSTAPGC